MNYSSDSIRRACRQLEGHSSSSTSVINPLSEYSNKLRKSCRDYSEKCSWSKDYNPVHDTQKSQISLHKKFVLAKLELKMLQEIKKNHQINSDLNPTGDTPQGPASAAYQQTTDCQLMPLIKSSPSPIASQYPHVRLADRVLENVGVLSSDQITNKTPASILKKGQKRTCKHRITFEPEALYWDAALSGDLDLLIRVSKTIKDFDVKNYSGITALHNAANIGSLKCVDYLIQHGCDVNCADNCGWTPLHYASYYKHGDVCKHLIECGASVHMKTLDDEMTPYLLCQVAADSAAECGPILIDAEEEIGIINDGIVYATHPYSKMNPDELSFEKNDQLKILRRGDDTEPRWWWAVNQSNFEGYVPYTLLSTYPCKEITNGILKVETTS